MANDNFKSVKFTAGQEVRAQDLVDSQLFLASRLLDQLMDYLTPGPRATGADFPDQRSLSGLDSATSYAYALTVGAGNPKQGTSNNKVKIGAGTLFQKIGAQSGNEPTLLPYVFPGTDEVTIANGNTVNPRVDLVQMKLEYENADSQARVFSQESVKASLDLAPLTANCETVIRARAGGFGGKSISIQFVADGSGAGSLTQSGYQLVFHYQSGVTTVANFETAVQASALIEVQTTDGVGTLTSPGDTFGPTFLTGGTDQVLVSQNLEMKRRVKMTLNVKQGTAATPPVFPAPDTGCVPIAAVLVGRNYTGASAFARFCEVDVTTDVAVLMDLRMPLAVKRYSVVASEGIFNRANWTEGSNGLTLTCATATQLLVKCPVTSGRIIGVALVTASAGASTSVLNALSLPGGLADGFCVLTTLLESGGSAVIKRGGFDKIEGTASNGGLANGPVATSPHGPPAWADGTCCPGQFSTSAGQTVVHINPVVGLVVHGVEFIVAEGV